MEAETADTEVTSSYTEPLDYGVGFPTSRLRFPGYFLMRFFTTYLEQPDYVSLRYHDLLPGRPIAQAVSFPHSPCVLATKLLELEANPRYCEVFTQLQNQIYRVQYF
jgi:hypothetical protein